MNSIKIFYLSIVLISLACDPPKQYSQQDLQVPPKPVPRNTLENLYGYEPEEILSMTFEDEAALIKMYNLKPLDFIKLKLSAEEALYDKQILQDSIEIQKIYDRIERKLSN